MQAWRPKPDLQLDQWADQYRRLSEEESAEAGQWYTDRVPHTREIMRAYTDAPDQVLWIMGDDPRVLSSVPWTKYNKLLVWIAPSQIGKTNIALNICGYHMHMDPCPMLVMEPTDDLATAFSEDKLEPMLRDTPILQGLVKDNKAKDSRNRKRSKKFPGGNIDMVSAASDSSLYSRSKRVFIADELDNIEKQKSGDPFLRGQQRLNAYEGIEKIFACSTPRRKESSRIEPLYEAGTRERWHNVCPSCGAYQELRFGKQLDFETLTYACGHCGTAHNKAEWMALPGRWVAENPDAPHRSFRNNAMVAPRKSWGTIVTQYRDALAEKERGELKAYITFVNEVEAMTWEETGQALAENHFTRQGNPQRHWYYADVPRWVKLITCSVDTQDDRVEFEVRGWGKGLQTCGIQYGVIYGHPGDAELNASIDALLDKTWIREDGAQLTIARLTWDAMGHYPDEVYAFTRPREPRVYAVRGGSEWHAPVIGRMGTVDKQGIKTPIFAIGTIAAKDMLYNMLKVSAPGPGFCHWPLDPQMSDGITLRGYDDNYFAMLTSEKQVKRVSRGVVHNAWVPKRSGIRNEAWDILVYGLAALLIYLGPLSIDDIPEPEVLPAPPIAQQPAGRRILSRGVRA